jgi:hypothetical protein
MVSISLNGCIKTLVTLDGLKSERLKRAISSMIKELVQRQM